MSMLENITRGRESKPPSLFIYGQEGVGKSTVGAAAPNPVFVQTEDGLGEIDTAKFPLAKNLNDVLAALNALRDEPNDFQTVVLDSADWLERLIWDQVCAEFGVRSIEKADHLLPCRHRAQEDAGQALRLRNAADPGGVPDRQDASRRTVRAGGQN